MKTKTILLKAPLLSKALLLSAALLLSGLSFAQIYHAGEGSGTGFGGFANVFVGYYAGHVSSGYENCFVGTFAGYVNTTGNFNSFLGSEAGHSNQTGSNNSFLGSFTGFNNTKGSDNSFLGTYAGISNTTGERNTFVGTSAGSYNKAGSKNSFIGYQAGYNNVSERNTFLGYQAGYANTTGVANCFVGAYAGLYNTGFSNCFLGVYAGYANNSGTDNSFVGRGAGYANTSGGFNSILGYAAGLNNTTGSNNLFLGAYANANVGTLSNAGAVGYQAYVTASNSLVLGSINGFNGATANTNVGIGTTAPGYLLHVNGTAAKPGGGSWTVASDKRLKKDIRAFTDGLDVVKQIKPVWFRYNGEAGLPKDQRYVGIIAQEMQQIAPYTIGKFTYQDTTGKATDYLDYDANAVTYLLVNSVKELKAENETQQQQIEELKGKLNEMEVLKQKLAQLEALLLQPGNAATSAQLYQNEPNPTDGSTVIRYVVPQEATSAHLAIYALNGQQVQRIDLPQKGAGQVQLSAKQLASGLYVYHLFVNGQSVASKKLLLEK